MWHHALIPFYDLVGALGFLVAAWYGLANYRNSDVERPFWFVFTLTSVNGALWLGLVSAEWFGFRSVLLDQFSTSLQAVVIGLYALGVVGAHVIVGELGRSQFEVEKRAALVSVLSRVLRHNIRNDITLIRGYVATDGGDDVVERTIDDLLATSEKAMKLERTIDSNHDLRPIEVEAGVRSAVDEARSTNPDASIEIRIDGDGAVPVAPSVQTAFTELVENAVVHGDESPHVVVTVSTTADAVTLSVRDDGPGMPEHEQRLLSVGEETPLLHSDGIGLWMAQWIVYTTGGRIDARVTDAGTTLTVVLPRDGADGRRRREVPDGSVGARGGRYHAIFERGIDACIVITDDGLILDANERAGELLGAASVDLLGRPIEAVLPEDVDVAEIRAELREGEVARGKATLSEGETASFSAVPDVVRGEHVLVLSDD